MPVLKAIALILVLAVFAASHRSQAATLEKLITPGPLSEAHQSVEDDCAACHSPLEDVSQASLCVACHENVGDDLQRGLGFHGKHGDVAGNECQLCHAEHKGLDAETLEFDWDGFSHADTDFPLLWAHGMVPCEGCHQPSAEFHDTPSTCIGCHRADDPHKGQLGKACDDCHDQRSWEATGFDHGATRFPLSGAHATLMCADCHIEHLFGDASTQCASCHQKDDVHKGRFGTQCQNCHNDADWQASFFDHGAATGFPLSAGHAGLTCEACHGASTARLSGSTCHSCHAEDDVHKGNNGTACESCHLTSNWQSTIFDHARMTTFVLAGAHASLECTACHTGALSDPVPGDCAGCHAADDPHERQLGDGCGSCHNESSWSVGVRFDHSFTAFPLVGKHAALECSLCHASFAFHDAPSECVSCHKADDPHRGSVGSECQSCHNPASWRHTSFDHREVSGFALEGVHDQLECAACHQKPAFLKALSTEQCEQCHRHDDPHQNRFGSDCGRCHTADSFARIKGF